MTDEEYMEEQMENYDLFALQDDTPDSAEAIQHQIREAWGEGYTCGYEAGRLASFRDVILMQAENLASTKMQPKLLIQVLSRSWGTSPGVIESMLPENYRRENPEVRD